MGNQRSRLENNSRVCSLHAGFRAILVVLPNVIRRREETNATRSLLNTAQVMESNGVALRLKQLETLEKVTENVGNLVCSGRSRRSAEWTR